MTAESHVQLQTEGTGPEVRTLKSTSPTAPDAAGAATPDTVVHQQVVATADRHGDLVEPSWQDSVLVELGLIREALQLISNQLE